MFDAILYVVKVIAGFYKVLYEDLKRNVLGCTYVFVLNFLC